MATATAEQHVVIAPRRLVARLGLTLGMRVGDFGVGGAAAFALDLARAVGPSGEVYMFDVQKTALSSALSLAAMHGFKNCRAVWSNLELFEGARGVRGGALDAGVLVNVLHQTNKPEDMLAEIHRMLKPGAKLLVVDWIPTTRVSFAPDAASRQSAGHIQQVARGLGFATTGEFEAGPNHWGLILVKT